MELTKEKILAGVDPSKVTVEELSAFAEANELTVVDGTKVDVLAGFVKQYTTAETTDAPQPPDPDLNIPDAPQPPDPDLNIPDAPPEEGEESDDLPPALARRGVKKRKIVQRKAAELPADAPPALKRRLS